MKKIVILLLLFVLVLGGFSVCQAVTLGNGQIRAGYGKKCINPELNGDGNFDPIPMGGFGNIDSRLCQKDKDAFSEERALYVTAIALSDSESGSDNAVYFVTVDNGAIGDISKVLRKQIAEACSTTVDKVFISATHTHSSVAATYYNLSEKSGEVPIEGLTKKKITEYAQKYCKFFIAKTVEACIAARADMSVANIYTGKVDFGYNKMGFVRHYTPLRSAETGKKFYDTSGEEIIYGDNYGLFAYDKDSKKFFASVTKDTRFDGHTSSGDPNLQMIKFEFANGSGKLPIYMVNWQVHPAFAGSLTSYYVSSDFIGYFRESIETEYNCRVAYYTGAAGDMNGFTEIWYDGDPKQPHHEGVTFNWKLLDGTDSGETDENIKRLNRAKNYGEKLAELTKEEMNGAFWNQACINEKATIHTKQENLLLPLKFINKDDANYTNLVKNAKFIQTIWLASDDTLRKMFGAGDEDYEWDTDLPDDFLGETSGETTTQKLRNIVYKYSDLIIPDLSGDECSGEDYLKEFLKNPRTRIHKFTTLLGEILGENSPSDTIWSPYHAVSIMNALGRTGSKEIEINAISIGTDIAFATAPFELFSDSGLDIKKNSSVNDKSNARMTFILELTNGSNSYLPTWKIYDRCYEGTETLFERGTAEFISQRLVNLIADAIQGEPINPTDNIGAYITFDANGGNGEMTSRTVNPGEKLPKNTFTRKGYTFQGWTARATNLNGNNNGEPPSTEIAPVLAYYTDEAVFHWSHDKAENITLYANWAPNTYYVRYEPNGGSGTMAERAITYNSAYWNIDCEYTGSGEFYCWRDEEGSQWNSAMTIPWIWDYDYDVVLHPEWKGIFEVIKNSSEDIEYCNSLRLACEAIPSGESGTITLRYDTVDISGVEIPSNKTITLNLNGHTLTRAATIVNEGNLTISGEGVLESAVTPRVRMGNLIMNKGTLTINNATVEHHGICDGIWFTIYSTSGNVTINHATVKSSRSSNIVAKNYGFCIGNMGDSNLTITNSTISSQTETVIFVTTSDSQPSATGNIQITGGKVINESGGSGYGISINPLKDYPDCSVSVEIMDCEITGLCAINNKGNGNISIGGNSSLTSTSEHAIINVGSGNISVSGGSITGAGNGVDTKGEGNIVISGGTLKGNNGNALCVYNASDVSITGGTLIGTENYAAVYIGAVSTASIGTKDGVVLTNEPILRGKYAVNTNKTFQFYDGILYGSSGIITGTGSIGDKEDNYDIVSGLENIDNTNYQVLYLGKPNYRVGDRYYTTLKEAYDSITGSEGTIVVNQNVTDGSALVVEEGKSIQLDTNGKTITKTENGIQNNGTLQITGSGTIQTVANGSDIETLIKNTGNLIINGESGKVILHHQGRTENYWFAITSTAGEVHIQEGIVKVTASAQITPQRTGYTIYNLGSTDVFISGGEVLSTRDTAIYSLTGAGLPAHLSGTITITGGKVESNGDGYGISINTTDAESYKNIVVTGGEVKGIRAIHNKGIGNITISGDAIITSTSDHAITNVSSGNILVSGGAITGAKDGINTSGEGNVTISGGTLKGNNGNALCAYKASNVSITGGTLIGTNYAAVYIGTVTTASIGTKDGFVSTNEPIIRGKYAVNTDKEFQFYDGLLYGSSGIITGAGSIGDSEENYDAVSSEENIDNTNYHVLYLAKPNYLVGNRYYATLKEAYDSITTEVGTIVVNRDVTDNSLMTVEEGKNIQLNTNGKTITKTENGIQNNGTLQITGSGTIQTVANGADIDVLVKNTGNLTINGVSGKEILHHQGRTENYWFAILSTAGEVRIQEGIVKVTASAQITPQRTGYTIYNLGSTDIVISGGEVLSTRDTTIYSTTGTGLPAHLSGTITITGGKVESSGNGYGISINTTDAESYKNIVITGGEVKGIRAIHNKGIGNITISGDAVITSTSDHAITNIGSSNILVSGGAITGAKDGINTSGEGNVVISGGALKGNNGNALCSYDASGIKITGGTLIGTDYAAVYIENTDDVEIGKKDSVVHVDNPILRGKYGIKTNRTFRFYDGSLYGTEVAIWGGDEKIAEISSAGSLQEKTVEIDSVEYQTKYIYVAYMKGDLDRNQIINVIDVRLLVQEIVNNVQDTEENLNLMDIDNNQTIDILDARQLLQNIINNVE